MTALLLSPLHTVQYLCRSSVMLPDPPLGVRHAPAVMHHQALPQPVLSRVCVPAFRELSLRTFRGTGAAGHAKQQKEESHDTIVSVPTSEAKKWSVQVPQSVSARVRVAHG